MTTDPTPSSAQPGPDTSIESDIDRTGKALGETLESLSAEADVEGQVEQKVADTKSRITEKAHNAKDTAVEKAHAAQSTARDAVSNVTGLVKPRMPLAALIAAAAVITIVVWRRR